LTALYSTKLYKLNLPSLQKLIIPRSEFCKFKKENFEYLGLIYRFISHFSRLKRRGLDVDTLMTG